MLSDFLLRFSTGNTALWKSVPRLILVALLCIVTLSVSALDATRQPSQLIHASWSRVDGLPAESIWSVHQSDDGYLWLGTEGGLVRFDGMDFKVFSSQTHEAFRADDIRTIVEGPPGTIWASTYGGGVVRVQDGEFTRYDKSDGLIHDVVYSMLVAKNGDVWAGTAVGACRLRDEQFKCWAEKDGLASGRIIRIAEDVRGRIWFATVGGGVSVFDGTEFETYSVEDGLGSSQVFMLVEDPILNLVLGTYAGDYHYAGPEGLIKMERGELPPGIIPVSALRDRHDNFWIGGSGKSGLWRMLPDVQRLDDPNDELTHIFAIDEDRSGGLWAATATGLHHYRAGPFTPWGESEGIADGTFVIVAAADDDGVWIGTEGEGLYHIAGDGKVNHVTEEDGLPVRSVSSLHMDSEGILWAGTFGGGVALVKDGLVIDVITEDEGLLHNQISAIYRDSDGAIWIGGAGGLNRWVDGAITHSLTTETGLLANLVRYVGEDRERNLLISSDSGLVRLSLDTLQVVDTFDRQNGLATDVVATTYVDRKGAIWIGQRSGGLARLVGDELYLFEREHELGIDSIMTIIEDYEGYLWLGGRRGLVRIAKSDLEDVVAGKSSRVISRSFSENDGLRSIRVPGGFRSASARTRDGRLWFATASGLAVVDPRHIPSIDEPLDIIIEDVQADGQSVSGGDSFRIPSGTQTIQVSYTVPRLHDADGLRFRYRLGGEEETWLDAGRRRTAFFTSLPARGNILEVGVTRIGQRFSDNQNAKFIELYVEPMWYQMYVFRIFLVILALLLALTSYRMALRRYRHRQKRLEELVDERTEALRAALGEVEKMSRTDSLTQVSNRRHFEERLNEVWQKAVELGRPVGVMMIDIDYFKQYNDVAGHQAGDECLVTVAQMLAKNVRGEDFVARYGGEEFVVILVGSDVGATRLIGKRIQSSVRELGLPHPGRPPNSVVTVSAGFATASPGHIDSPEELVKRADEALYQAKEKGRDCIVVDGEWAQTG